MKQKFLHILRAAAVLRRAALLSLATLAIAVAALPALAAEPVTKAVVVMYHRFGEGDFPSTNVTMEQFKAHVEELKTGGYNVVSLSEIAAALKNGTPLPNKAVGLSVDDAYESVVTHAWPILKEAGFPLTVFVATDPVDRKLHRYMNWDQIRALAADGVTIGGHSVHHPHMVEMSEADIRKELEDSAQRYTEELGKVPELFAYPYGEADARVVKAVQDAGYTAAFGQYSGAIGTGSPQYYLPRFAMNESYGSADRFALAANTLPLSVSDFVPAEPTLQGRNPPNIGLTVTWPGNGTDRLNCYMSHVDKVAVERLGARVEIRTDTPLPNGRTRLNCTMPAGDGRWHWFGWQYYVGK